MNKKNVNLLIIILILCFIPLIFFNAEVLSTSILNTSKIFITKVFPFLFIMMVINEILISLNFHEYLFKLTKSHTLYIVIMSLLGGSPLNASIISSLLKKKALSIKNASKILSFTSFNNPLFLYNYFKLIFNNPKITFILFVIIYLCNFIFYIMFRPQKENLYLLNNDSSTFTKALPNAIKNSTSNLLNIFGTIVIFKLISDLFIQNNSYISIILRGMLELTQGLNALTSVNINTLLKLFTTLVIVSFSGLSIHIQISSILSDFNIDYKYFYISRLTPGFIIGIISIISKYYII